MTTTSANQTSEAPAVDLKLEIVVIPVSDVERAKQFYAKLGWRLDADFAGPDDYRVIQFTPPGSNASVIFGKNVTSAAPGSAQGLYLVVSDIEAASRALRKIAWRVRRRKPGSRRSRASGQPPGRPWIRRRRWWCFPWGLTWFLLDVVVGRDDHLT